MDEKGLVVGYASAKGTRREKNEDRYLANAQRGLFIVADGIGAHIAGETASEIAVNTISRSLRILDISESDVKYISELIRSSIDEANETVHRMASEDSSLRGMGTTVVIALIRKGLLYLAHIGDSRAYLVRDNTIDRLTRDHSVLEELIESGRMTAEEARNHPMRHVITRALGTETHVKADMRQVEIRSGDCIILCTDGLSDAVSENAILNTVIAIEDPPKACNELVAQALERGGADNITVLAVRFEPSGDPK